MTDATPKTWRMLIADEALSQSIIREMLANAPDTTNLKITRLARAPLKDGMRLLIGPSGLVRLAELLA